MVNKKTEIKLMREKALKILEKWTEELNKEIEDEQNEIACEKKHLKECPTVQKYYDIENHTGNPRCTKD
ncbi:hypothetical protein [Halalkalibacter akibai]|uniref:Uncharacterized protein n=1 Tax=Halalkalibacter akibai (strain ATCC 43226 / DSM 21942 / CIP 109018 / JCM 9157 / 1139) TaxID=1236973 RepID=W4QWJ8_HALA3|nr:hypothetical protein [Halalkalibacter akibai]GAE35704.1 hypothetical protein JCM9157_2824 [Halalkalibacter akibai JCM 9157]